MVKLGSRQRGIGPKDCTLGYRVWFGSHINITSANPDRVLVSGCTYVFTVMDSDWGIVL